MSGTNTGLPRSSLVHALVDVQHPAPTTVSPDGVQLTTKETNEAAAPQSKYTDLDSLLDFALSGDVQFVKASYCLTLARQGGIFPRRQDLPPEARVSPADVRRWGDEVRATLALRKKFTEGYGVEEIQHGVRFPPFVVTSYAWCELPRRPARGPARC